MILTIYIILQSYGICVRMVIVTIFIMLRKMHQQLNELNNEKQLCNNVCQLICRAICWTIQSTVKRITCWQKYPEDERNTFTLGMCSRFFFIFFMYDLMYVTPWVFYLLLTYFLKVEDILHLNRKWQLNGNWRRKSYPIVLFLSSFLWSNPHCL